MVTARKNDRCTKTLHTLSHALILKSKSTKRHRKCQFDTCQAEFKRTMGSVFEQNISIFK